MTYRATPTRENPEIGITQEEYWNNFNIIRSEIGIATRSFYTYTEINRLCRDDKIIEKRLNDAAYFWNFQMYALQSTFFISLSRIFDDSSEAHTIDKFLKLTTTHPEFFSERRTSSKKNARRRETRMVR
jgi:hypothetical protein